MLLSIPISVGELIDKITILQIKDQRIQDATKLKNIRTELAYLLQEYHKNLGNRGELMPLWQDLKNLNEKLWEIEDEIRLCEKQTRFDDYFIELARKVYLTNDQRARVKHKVNQLTGSLLIEEKSYEDYSS